jgi:peptide/nickel transport system substrate-binding protein
MRYGGATGKLVIGLVLVLVVGLVAAACGGDDDELAAPAPAAPAAAAEAVVAAAAEPEQPVAAAAAVAAAEAAAPETQLIPVERGVLRLFHTSWWGGQEVLDPAAAATWTPVRELLYDRMIVLNEQGIPTPFLASSWEVDDSLQRWTFKVREGVTFSDGSTLDSQDFKYTMEHVLNPDTGGQAASVLTMVDPEGFETPDDNTFVMNLFSPSVDLPMLMRNETLRVIPDGQTREFMVRDAIGTGPYTIEKISIDGLSSFASRDDWWGGLPGTKEATVVLITGADARVQALLADQLSMASALSIAQAQQVEGDDDFYILENATGSIQIMVALQNESPYDTLQVRQAMKAAMDPDEMIALTLQGHGAVACNNPVGTGDQYRLPLECPQDLDRARALLAEAGYAEGIDIELITSNLSGPWLGMATAYQQQAAPAGIDVSISLAPADGYWSEIWTHVPFSMSSWGWRGGAQVLNEMFRCSAGWNEGEYCDADYEALLDLADAEPDFAARKALYQQAQQHVVDTSGVMIPFFQNYITALNSRVDGWEEWWFSTERFFEAVTVDPR